MRMSKMRNHFPLELWILFCYITYHNASGLQLDLTRFQTGDYFNNPYTTSRDDDDNKFCVATNSICDRNRPEQGDKCCYCICRVTYSTFNLTTLRCAPNSDFRSGSSGAKCRTLYICTGLPPLRYSFSDECSYRFGGDRRYDKLYLNVIDMTASGHEKIVNRDLDDKSQKHLKHCVINKIEQINSIGYETVSSHPFRIKDKPSFDLEWSKADHGDTVHGRVYRITLTCQYKSGSITGCLMLKSAGTVQVYHPGLPENSSTVLPTSTAKTTALLPSSSPSLPSSLALSSSPSLPSSPSSLALSSPRAITEILSTIQRKTTSQWTGSSSSPSQEILPTSTGKEFIQPTSTSRVNSPSSTQWTIPLQSSVKEERVEVSTTKTASSTIDNRGNQEETTAPSSSSIATEFPTSPEKERHSSENGGGIMVYVIVVVVVFVVALIALAVVVRFIMKRKKKKMLKKRESKANIIMSDMNKNNINEDEDGFYTALDKSAGNDESNYQALTLPGTNKNQPRANGYNEKMRQNENGYVYADADGLYSTIVDDRKPGAKNNDAFVSDENERVYSILEQHSGQVNYTTPNMRDDSERVYSILETEPGQIAYPTPTSVNSKPAGHGYTGDSDVDYVTVLTSKSDPGQSDCSVYADLSGQRDGENEYQSLVKRKK